MRESDINPITRMDYPDPDIIRVDDVYYMVSTTMHFMPGGAILKSYDLVNWELVTYIFDKLDDTPAERLEQENVNYGKGMWAPTIRYHEGRFYVAFISQSIKKTFLFTSENIEGPWKQSFIEGVYHDMSLLFDDDGRVFVVYGNREIHLTELKPDLTGPLEGGVDKVIITEKDDVILGYEGSHFYKINGKYYIFLIHWPKSTMLRTEACFVCDTVDGEYKGGDVLSDDRHFRHSGIAQGGIVDTPTGKWFSIMFQDSGAVGRMPILVPIHWENDYPVFGINGKAPDKFEIASSRPYYRCEPLYTSDDFKYPEANPRLKLQWQWNHQTDMNFWRILPEGGLYEKTNKLCVNVTHAQNMLTQRMMWPKCEAEVTVDASNLKDGDVAGLCALQGNYGLVGITKISGAYYIVNIVKKKEEGRPQMGSADYMPGVLVDQIRLKSPKVVLGIKANFDEDGDRIGFFYLNGNRFSKVGQVHPMFFGLDHFCGARFGLFIYSTKEIGGSVVFTDFIYRPEN